MYLNTTHRQSETIHWKHGATPLEQTIITPSGSVSSLPEVLLSFLFLLSFLQLLVPMLNAVWGAGG